jgi:hypothetical protein
LFQASTILPKNVTNCGERGVLYPHHA